MTTVLLLGADGFLGRGVLAQLREEGYRVVCAPPVRDVDLVSLGPDGVRRMMDEDTAVLVNCAGAVGGDEQALERANVELPRLLAEVCAHRIALVHLGSAAEYGPTGREPVEEDHVCRPVNPYGRTKLDGTRAVVDGCSRSTVLRVFNPIGPGQSPATLPGQLLAAIARGDPEVATGPLGAVRDYVSTRDIARAVAYAVRVGPVAGRIFNVAGGRGVLVRDLARRILAAAGTGQILREAAASSTATERKGTDWSVADIEAARAALSWSPQDDLDAAIDRMLWTPAPTPG